MKMAVEGTDKGRNLINGMSRRFHTQTVYLQDLRVPLVSFSLREW